MIRPRWSSSPNFFLYIIYLIWISRISFDPWDGRKIFGLITCGSCCARVSATLQAFTPEWFLIAEHVDWLSLEMCGMYWLFSLCDGIGRRRRGSAQGGKLVREHPWMRHVTHQMTKLIWRAQRCLQITLGLGRVKSSALSVRCALWSNYTASLKCFSRSQQVSLHFLALGFRL